VKWTFNSVALVGAGAVGTYYGGRLAQHGEAVRFLLRADYGAVRRLGIRVSSVHGDFCLPQVQGFRTAAEIGPVDLVIVAWKATANGHLATVLPPLVHDGTQVLTLQNGLGNCEALAEIVGPERVLGGLCFVCINRLAPGVVKHTAGGRIAVGEWRPDDRGRAGEVARRFKAAGIPAEAVADLEAAQWQKLVWNIPFNGLAVAAGGVTTDVLLANPETAAEVRSLMEEVVAAACALGLPLTPDLIDLNIERTRPMGPYRPSSMIDYLAGQEVELGPIWEEPLRRARQAGVPMPRLEALVKRLRQRLAERAAPGG
jgi:2-dehydropantoate 2-reductase